MVTATDNVSITGCGGNVIWTWEITGAGPCKYSKISITATFKTGADAILNIAEQPYKRIEGGFFCPIEGKPGMDFGLNTTAGTTLLIS